MAVHWEKPMFGTLKLKTDASVCQGRGFGGGILRDHEGKLVFAFYKEFGDMDVITAEACSLLTGLIICKDRGLQHLQVEVDSEVLVRLVNSKVIAKWPLINHIRQIRALLSSLSAS